MGYTTDFYGEITLNPPLNDHEISFLQDFNESRRMIRKNGPLFVRGTGFHGQNHDDDVIDGNRASGEPMSTYRTPTPEEQETYDKYYEPGGQPGLWCQWVPNDDGTELVWDEGEKFYNAPEWMKYLITKLLHGDEARAYVGKHLAEDERLQYFAFDHVANGKIFAEGEQSDDRWALVVKDSVVMVATTEVIYNDPKEV